MRTQWDETAVATLKRRHAEGRSAREIAIELRTTRNAVIGKLFRLGLSDGDVSRGRL